MTNGHPTYVLDALPRPGYQPPNRTARILTGMHGRLWIEKKGFHWVKGEAEVLKPVSIFGFFAKVLPGTRMDLEMIPVTRAQSIDRPERGEGTFVPKDAPAGVKRVCMPFLNCSSWRRAKFASRPPITCALSRSNRLWSSLTYLQRSSFIGLDAQPGSRRSLVRHW